MLDVYKAQYPAPTDAMIVKLQDAAGWAKQPSAQPKEV
jgi:hypothetical protein